MEDVAIWRSNTDKGRQLLVNGRSHLFPTAVGVQRRLSDFRKQSSISPKHYRALSVDSVEMGHMLEWHPIISLKCTEFKANWMTLEYSIFKCVFGISVMNEVTGTGVFSG